MTFVETVEAAEYLNRFGNPRSLTADELAAQRELANARLADFLPTGEVNRKATSAGTMAHEIIGQAAKIVSGDRAAQHGPKERNHQNIADHWNAYLTGRLDVPLTALDVALMMVELKIARTKAGAGRTNHDNYVDGAGYFGVAGEIALNGKEVK